MNTRLDSVVQSIAQKGICCGCGCCEMVCPTKSIEMRLNRFGQIEPHLIGNCTGCGECFKVCPFHEDKSEDNRHNINKMLFGNYDVEVHPILGKYVSCYLANANDKKINLAGASGGMVSLMLIHLLKARKIDAAVVTNFSNKNGYMFEMKFVGSIDDVLNSAKSKYYPTTCSAVSKEIISTGKKFAFVGLPCQVYGLRKIQKNYPDKLSNLVYIFGLVCGQNKSTLFTDFLIRTLNLLPEQVVGLDYRDKDKTRSDNYSFLVTGNKNAKIISKRLPALTSIYGQLFTQRCFSIGACKYCDDIYSELADVSFMDAWLPECIRNYKGESIIISRNRELSNLFEELHLSGKCSLKQISIDKVIQSQRGVIRYKRELLPGRLALWKNWKNNVITQRIKPSKSNLIKYLPEHLAFIFNEKLTKIVWSFKWMRVRIVGRILLWLTSKKANRLLFLPFSLLSRIGKAFIRKKKTNVLFLGQGTFRNRGCEALLTKTMSLLDKSTGSMKFIVPMFLYNSKCDKKYSKLYSKRAKIFPVYKRTAYSIFQGVKRRLGLPYEKFPVDYRVRNLYPYYRDADLVVAVGGDNYTMPGKHPPRLHLAMLKFAKTLGKSTVISAASIGPFPREEEKWIAGILKMVDLITVRETETLNYLGSLGIVDNVKLVVDPAYLLSPDNILRNKYWKEDTKRIKIGINMSGLVNHVKNIKYEAYIDIFASFIKKAIDRYHATILLVPHVTIEESCDLKACKDVYKKLNGNQNVAVLGDYLNAAQTKYVIGQSDYFIGARMHSTIASLSSGVPTLAIAHSRKIYGIFKDHFGNEDYVIDLDELSEELLFKKIDLIISKREEIKEILNQSMNDYLERAKLNGDYIRSVLNNVKR